jgi:hypothetical protein
MSYGLIIFAMSISAGLFCIAKARPSDRIQLQDAGFFLACWEPFNFGYSASSRSPAPIPTNAPQSFLWRCQHCLHDAEGSPWD